MTADCKVTLVHLSTPFTWRYLASDVYREGGLWKKLKLYRTAK